MSSAAARRNVGDGPGSEDLYPMLRAENAEVLIHPSDRKYGALLIGGQGCGKCIGPDDLILLAGRLIRAEAAWNVYATTPEFDGEGWWSQPLEQPLTCSLDACGRMVAAPVVRLYRQHVREPVRKIRLSDGSELTVTSRHRLRGADEWTNDLREGAVICVPRRVDWPGTEADRDLVELVSWQIADGCETTGAKNSRRGSSVLTITQSDLTVLEHLRELVITIGERYGLRVHDPRINPEHRAPTLSINSAEWRDFLVQRGYHWGRLSREKAIPDFIMQGDLEAARVCLRAFADAEGSVAEQHRTVELTTASRVLGEQIRMLLRRFGILASFRLKRASATNGSRIEREYQRLTVSGNSLRTFLAEIGFGYEYKDERLRRMLAGIKKNSNREGVYTQDIICAVKDLGAPLKWISSRSWNYLYTLRASSEIAAEMARNLRTAADRLDSKCYAAPGARGVSALRRRSAVLEAIDTDVLRKDADRLESRIRQEVFYLTVERIEEVDYDGWVYDFEVPEHHNFVAGGMLAHNTSALLSFYLNDIEDEDAAPIVIDPKSELSRICLRLTPPDCGKRVWFLDLGHPAFGMSPLRLIGDRPLAIEAAQIADNVVAALLDINENQIYQSSRRYLTHAVIGAIAIATKQGRRARLEDVYTLLRPAKDEFRSAVAEACADQPDLDQTAEFYRSELPDDLRMATSRVAERLDAPRNKISGLTGVPPLRRFFNHPTDVPLREIVQARDILIVDANMAAIGTENSKACMLFILRMLHAQLQRQVHLPESDRPRVPLLVDEAHYVASGENVVDQIATHRAAGLEAAFGLQYFAQLGSASEHQQKILKGVLNLLQSRFLFRMGDAQDAEQATRIAMAVYSTMIRDDPDSRARLRVTPEQALNFPNYYCLASWIANGTRAPSFMGQTYPLPDVGDEWGDAHLEAQDRRVGPYPEELESTLASHVPVPDGAIAGDVAPPSSLASPPAGARTPQDHQVEPSPPKSRKHEVRVDYEAPTKIQPSLANSPIRGFIGRPSAERNLADTDGPPSDTLRALSFLDRINEIGAADQLDGVARLPRLYDEDFAILALLDRVGLVPAALIGRVALPGRAPRSVADRLIKLYRHGLVARHTTGLRQHAQSDGKPPFLYSLTRRGLKVGQERQPPAISPRREWRAIEQPRAARLAHDLHALGWAIEFHRIAGSVATDGWRTPRYATGRYPVPQVGQAHRRHELTLNEIPIPDGQAIIDLELKKFTEIKPDLSLELRIPEAKITFDLLVEIDLTARPSYNREKFLAYDAFLCGWSLAHSRFKAHGTRPAVVFVCPNDHAALACAREADELLTGRIGVMGTPAEHWYYAGRDHLFFACEEDIHRRSASALALPAQPPGLRERLGGSRELGLSRVSLCPVASSHEPHLGKSRRQLAC